jgi:hypothetical protein
MDDNDVPLAQSGKPGLPTRSSSFKNWFSGSAEKRRRGVQQREEQTSDKNKNKESSQSGRYLTPGRLQILTSNPTAVNRREYSRRPSSSFILITHFTPSFKVQAILPRQIVQLLTRLIESSPENPGHPVLILTHQVFRTQTMNSIRLARQVQARMTERNSMSQV